MASETNNLTLSKCVVTHPERGEVSLRGVKTKESGDLWASQRKDQTDGKTGILKTILKHQVTPKKLDLLHLGGLKSRRSTSDSWYCEKSNEFSWYYEKQSKQLNRSGSIAKHSLLHANSGSLTNIHLKLQTNAITPLLSLLSFFRLSSSKTLIFLPLTHLNYLVHSSPSITTNIIKRSCLAKPPLLLPNKPWMLNIKKVALQFLK